MPQLLGKTLQIGGPKDQFSDVSLMEPVPSGYLMFAVEVDHCLSIGGFIQWGRKTRLMRDLKAFAQTLRGLIVLRARLI